MRLKKTLYAAVMVLTVASMVAPQVSADGLRIPKYQGILNDPSISVQYHDKIVRHKGKSKKPIAAAGNRRLPNANNGIYTAGSTTALAAVTNPNRRIPDVSELIRNAPANKASRVDPGLMAMATDPQPIELSNPMRKKLGIRDKDAPTETAEARQAKMTAKFIEMEKGLTRGDNGSRAVLPSSQLADNSAMSTVGFVGFGGVEDFFDQATLLADTDGNNKMERDFDNNTFPPGNNLVPRTLVDRVAKVEDDILLSDEVYMAGAISGHQVANGFTSNVFYTATNAGFINILEDAGGDGNFLPGGPGVTTPVRTIAVQNLTVGGVRLSNSASVTGLAVQQDCEFDGDLNSDEVVYFSVFDAEFGSTNPGTTPVSRTSFIGVIFDSADADEIPDTATLLFTGRNEISVAGVALDSYGHLYFHLTNLIVGNVLALRDTNENRFVGDTGDLLITTVFNAVSNLDFFNAANAVGMAIDKSDAVYLNVASGIPTDAGAGPTATGLPSSVISYVDRCGDVDPITGVLPRADGFADVSFRFYAAQADVEQPAGGGTATPVLVLPGLQMDYSGYGGLEVDYDGNVYVAVGAAPGGESGDPSPRTGAIFRIPDKDCDRIGDGIDFNGNRVFAEGELNATDDPEGDDLVVSNDYLWVEAPLVSAGLTRVGINFIEFGPLFSLNRVGLGLGDEGGEAFVFDAVDGIANNIAGGDADILRTSGAINVGSNTFGGRTGFEFLFCNVAFTGFRLGANGVITLRRSTLAVGNDPILNDFTPTVPEFLTGGTSTGPQGIIAPLWTDLNANDASLSAVGGNFSVNRIGFASVDAFIIQWINFPQFGLGGAQVNVDPFGRPGPGNVNTFDLILFDDQDFNDDAEAEFVQDTTNCNNAVNDDNDGVATPAGIGFSRPGTFTGVTQIIDRNGDGDVTDENIADPNVAQEGVGRTIPEQGPFKIIYHQIEAIGTVDQAVIVGFSTGFDPLINTGTIPPGVCETNLSRETPAPDAPFYYCGAIGCGTEAALYEFFNQSTLGSTGPDGLPIGVTRIDVDLRQETSDPELGGDCVGIRPERLFDTEQEECLLFKGTNIPIGLFCQAPIITLPAGQTPGSPFFGATNFSVNGFNFPEPRTGVNEICPAPGGTTTPILTRNGKSITCAATITFDENGDGIVDATISLGQTAGTPNLGRVRVVNENQILLEGLNFATTEICGGAAVVTVTCTYSNFDPATGNGADNRYSESRPNATGACSAVGPVTLVCRGATNLFGLRAPVVLSIAPDNVLCIGADDPDNVEDVQINGICFGQITSAFLTTTPDGSGTRIPINNVVNVTRNTVTGTISIPALTPNTPYFVFVVRSDGAISTRYPNVFGFDVTFSCEPATVPPVEPGPTLTTCRVRRVSQGRFVLQVNGTGFIVNNTIVLLNGQPCPQTKYPSKFQLGNGTTTRLNCTGGIKNLLPATVTTRNTNGTLSTNSLQCDQSSN